MTRIIAAIDNTAAARPVFAVAALVGRLFDAAVDAVHVREDSAEVAEAAASAAGFELRELTGPVVEQLVAAATPEDVVALVMGARATPAGPRPAGHTALAVVTSTNKPVVVVPPDARIPDRLRRVLVPLNGTMATARSLEEVIRTARACELDVVVLHVHDESSLPPFSDQPQHEAEAWAREFMARYCPEGAARAEVRIGVPGPEVVRLAAGAAADLIALGWSQDLSPGRAAVVREVLERGRVPVLLVTAGARGAGGSTTGTVQELRARVP